MDYNKLYGELNYLKSADQANYQRQINSKLSSKLINLKINACLGKSRENFFFKIAYSTLSMNILISIFHKANNF